LTSAPFTPNIERIKANFNDSFSFADAIQPFTILRLTLKLTKQDFSR
jgi:hypothetical protein